LWNWVGNISDDFDVVKDADWIVEAVVERIDIKHQIYEKIFKDILSQRVSNKTIKIIEDMSDILNNYNGDIIN
jgi:3-hydroxyacyl-CoA dehydrogenase